MDSRGHRPTLHSMWVSSAAIPALIITGWLTGGCAAVNSAPPEPALADTLTIFAYEDSMPPELFADFTAQTGVQVEMAGYTSYEEAVASLEAGDSYDVIWIGNIYVEDLVREGLLTDINFSHVPNARHIAPDFRDPLYDPERIHSVPSSWGTTGLVFRQDLVGTLPRDWDALWEYPDGVVGIWDDMRTMMGVALKTLGYSVNTDREVELQAAGKRLMELVGRAVFMEDYDPYTSAYALADGTVPLALGWAYDYLAGRDLDPDIQYIIPEDGAILWGESLVIPASSDSPFTAEALIDYLMRPEVDAQIVNTTLYASAHETSRQFIKPSILNETAIFPTTDMLRDAEVLMPLKPAVRTRYEAIWRDFVAAVRAEVRSGRWAG